MRENSFLIAFLGAVFAGLLAGSIMKISAKFEPKNPAPMADMAETKYGKCKLIRIASAFVVAGWLSIIGMTVDIILLFLTNEIHLLLFLLPMILVSGLSYIAICPFLKCENCGRAMTVQWTTKPPFSQKMWGIEGWASTILQVLILKRFSCMYCGKKYSIK